MAAELMDRLVADVTVIRRNATPRPMRRVAVNVPPPPLIPAGLKLRDRRMPLDADEFSRLMDGATTAAKWAAFQLMRRCWREVPTGTLPAHEGQLREAAGLSGDYKSWKLIRTDALRPFTVCSDGRYHCHLLVEALAAICRHRGGKRPGPFREYAREFSRNIPEHIPDGFPDNSTTYDAARGLKTTPNVPTRLISPSPIRQSVLKPRAREVDPTPTRLKDAQQDHEHEGQAETTLPDNWQPSPADIAAVKLARPDLDDRAIERQRKRFIEKARGTLTSHEWARQFVAFAKSGHGKPWSAAPSSSSSSSSTDDRPANSHARTSETDEFVLWRARLKDCEPGKPIRFWPSQWGPKPGERGCQVPRSLLIERGFQP